MSWVDRFELVSSSLRLVGSKLLLQDGDNPIIPGVMKILLRRHGVYLLACAAAVSVRRRMQRLMDVADEMNEKRGVAGRAPFM